jgi:hypothetical protein
VKRIISFTLFSILALVLTACGASAAASQSNSPSGSLAGTGSPDQSNPAPINVTPPAGPSALQLAAGIIKLDGTSDAVTAQEAGQLLPLWQSLQQLENGPTPQAGAQGTPGPRFDPANMQQVGAQVVLIENAMTPAQIQAITAMNLSRQDIFTTLQQVGIAMGGPGQGGGSFGPNGGTFTPPQGTPRAPRTPGAYQGNGSNFNGGRQGFGNFIPQTVVDGIVQFLQKKAGA